MKNIETVNAYKTTDNVLHLDFESATRHQEKLDLKNSINEFCKKHFSYMDQDVMSELMFEYWDEIKSIVYKTTKQTNDNV